ncbi:MULTISPECIES: PorP/SprF family type IX secretion system membrane protein [Flavobacterium]|jgi:type IX secretion system PorP/SprF family membrane protein|uniref:Type IX secretion system membrane protein PorP/SprF n=1 Tax=Flavobacterium hankyongi TaxID=1176532 RepID=A0ABP8ZNH1_9FLAO|nr:type IX secretion system membrane protein PorP/SprF [Flavobacterium sp. N1846]
MKKIFFTALVVVLAFTDANAQQDPHYTQYMYNMNVMNPAYAGSKENLSFGLLFRKQWVEIEDSPTTFTATGHSPVGKNVGLGLSVISDRIGPVEENNIYGDFSYTLNLGGDHRLAAGIKAGVTFQKIGLNSQIASTLAVPNDGPFAQDTSNSHLNMGAGLFYYTNKYYLAFSIPNMLKSAHLDYNGVKYGSEVQHYFLTGGYVFNLSEKTKFKPHFMLKSAFGAPTSLDVSTNFLFFDKFELGATYRLDDSFGALVNYRITDGLRIGYAYDHIVSDLDVTTPSSHEVMLLFDLNFPKKVSSSPRYF